ncbi:MAG: hypothetical protein IPH18_15260 [Chitinophagaceae bacterium]|nr:hypothetical protein [Chitinophagaceae bacterium]
MTGLFKQKTPVNFFVLLLFGLLIKLPVFLNPHLPVIRPGDGVLYKEMLRFLQPSNPIVYPLLTWLLLYVQAVMLNRIVNMNRMMTVSTWFPGMSYMLITSLWPEWNYFSAPLLVNTFYLLIIQQLFKIYNISDAKGKVYNVGLVAGIAAFFYFSSAAFTVWILLTMVIMRPFRLNEWMLCLLGVFTPFYFFAAGLFISDQWDISRQLPHIVFGLPQLKQSVWLAASVLLLLLPFLFGGYFIQDGLRKMLIQVRKGWSLLLLFILFALFIPFLNDGGTLESWIFAAIPFAAFHASMYLYSSLRIVPLLFFWVTVVFIIAFQYAGPRW